MGKNKDPAEFLPSMLNDGGRHRLIHLHMEHTKFLSKARKVVDSSAPNAYKLRRLRKRTTAQKKANPSSFNIKNTLVYKMAMSPMRRAEFEEAEHSGRPRSAGATTGRRSGHGRGHSSGSGSGWADDSGSRAPSPYDSGPGAGGSMQSFEGGASIRQTPSAASLGRGSRQDRRPKRGAGRGVSALADGPLARALAERAAADRDAAKGHAGSGGGGGGGGGVDPAAHKPLRVYRHELPAPMTEIYVRFLTMLNVMDAELSQDLLDDLMADAREHRNHTCLNVAAALNAVAANPDPARPGDVPYPVPDIVEYADGNLREAQKAEEIRRDEDGAGAGPETTSARHADASESKGEPDTKSPSAATAAGRAAAGEGSSPAVSRTVQDDDPLDASRLASERRD